MLTYNYKIINDFKKQNTKKCVYYMNMHQIYYNHARQLIIQRKFDTKQFKYQCNMLTHTSWTQT